MTLHRWITRGLGTDAWIVAPSLTDELRKIGFRAVLTPERYAALKAAWAHRNSGT